MHTSNYMVPAVWYYVIDCAHQLREQYRKDEKAEEKQRGGVHKTRNGEYDGLD